jgi:hypothetical protein
MKKILIILATIFTFSTFSLFAQAPPSPPGNAGTGGGPVGSGPIGAPIDDGTLILFAFAMAYAGRKLVKRKKIVGQPHFLARQIPGSNL